MELRIKQRVFSWADTYDIYDETGKPKYFVKGELFSLGHRIHIYDQQTGMEAGCVAQRLLSLLPTFDIYIGGKMVGTVKRKFTVFAQNYLVDYRDWNVTGDFLGWDYQVTDSRGVRITISKKWMSWGDTYTLCYGDADDELPGLLLVIAIDAANCDHNQ